MPLIAEPFLETLRIVPTESSGMSLAVLCKKSLFGWKGFDLGSISTMHDIASRNLARLQPKEMS